MWGLLLTPTLPVSLHFNLFHSTPLFFFFSSGLGWNVHLPHQICMAFCFLNHLLAEFDMMSSLLTWRHSWKSGAMKVGSQVSHIKLISARTSGPSSILALWQHAVQEKLFFPPLILLEMRWRKVAYPREWRGTSNLALTVSRKVHLSFTNK